MSENRHRNIAKLLFINLLGYPTQFGQVETIKCLASGNYTEKRIGYLAISQLMSESTELLMLVTNSIKTDLNCTNNNFNVALGLTAIAEVSTEEMCRELYQEVKKLMRNNSSYIKKKAIIAACRVVKNIPETIEDFMDPIDALMHEHSHSIQLATLTLVYEVGKVDPSYIPQLAKYAPNLKKTLKNLLHSGYAPEYDIAGIKDPFLQGKIL